MNSHGKTHTSEYKAWGNMKSRCSNSNIPCYPQYGGRGIAVCPEWFDFELFYKDMGDKPSTAHTIDRIDNNGNYEPGNCRWVTYSQQNMNRAVFNKNGTGFTGVYLVKGRFRAFVHHNSTQHHVGMFDTPEIAASARNNYITHNNLPNNLNKIQELTATEDN